MMRGMDRAQAQHDAMEPPDYYADATEGDECDEDDPDDERERRAEERGQDEEAHWAREDNE